MIRSNRHLQLLLGSLVYDKRRNGAAGRVVSQDVPELGVRKGWRLEANEACPDPGQLDHLSVPPGGLRLLLWGTKVQTMAKHRNPIFARSLGVTPERLCTDELHALHLGVFQVYILEVLWRMVEANVYAVPATDQETLLELTCLRIKVELDQWYGREQMAKPDVPVHRLPDFSAPASVTLFCSDVTPANEPARFDASNEPTRSEKDEIGLRTELLRSEPLRAAIGTTEPPKARTIGTKRHKALAAKAAQSGTLLLFAVEMAAAFAEKLRCGRPLLQTGLALKQYLAVTRSHGLKLPPAARQSLLDCCVRFLSVREAADLPFRPKMHQFVHLVADVGFFGNPLLTANWVDEGLNMQLAAVAKAAHAAVWSRRVLATFRHSLGPAAQAVAQDSKRRRRWRRTRHRCRRSTTAQRTWTLQQWSYTYDPLWQVRYLQ